MIGHKLASTDRISGVNYFRVVSVSIKLWNEMITGISRYMHVNISESHVHSWNMVQVAARLPVVHCS